MLTIGTPEILVSTVNDACPNHYLTWFEAKILLGYFEGSDYSLLYNEKEKCFTIHDNQDVDEESGAKGSWRYVIAECTDLCYEILDDARKDDNSTKDYIDILERDEYILNRLYCDFEE